MTTLPLGDGTDFDFRVWIWLIFAALSVVGGILGKKKQQNQKRRERGAPRAGGPKTRVQAPTPRRVPQPPRPQWLPTPAAPTARLPEARPARPRPSPPPPRPVEARPRPLVREAPPRYVPMPAEVKAAPVKAAAPRAPARGEMGAAGRPAVRAVQLQQVQRLLGSRVGLRSAFVLSEILAQPVALRENHLL